MLPAAFSCACCLPRSAVLCSLRLSAAAASPAAVKTGILVSTITSVLRGESTRAPSARRTGSDGSQRARAGWWGGCEGHAALNWAVQKHAEPTVTSQGRCGMCSLHLKKAKGQLEAEASFLAPRDLVLLLQETNHLPVFWLSYLGEGKIDFLNSRPARVWTLYGFPY